MDSTGGAGGADDWFELPASDAAASAGVVIETPPGMAARVLQSAAGDKVVDALGSDDRGGSTGHRDVFRGVCDVSRDGFVSQATEARTSRMCARTRSERDAGDIGGVRLVEGSVVRRPVTSSAHIGSRQTGTLRTRVEGGTMDGLMLELDCRGIAGGTGGSLVRMDVA